MLAELSQQIQQAALGELPALIGKLEQAKALALFRLSCAPLQTAAASSNGGNAFLNVEEVHQLLNVPVSYVYDLARQHKLPSVKVGKYLRFQREAILHWVEERVDRLSTVLITSPQHDEARGQGLAKAVRRQSGAIRQPRRRAPNDRIQVGAGDGHDSHRNGASHPGANEGAS